jgi:hypothetical protein
LTVEYASDIDSISRKSNGWSDSHFGQMFTKTVCCSCGLCAIEGSGFPRDSSRLGQHPWNLHNLPFLSASMLRHVGSQINGVTQPWLYMGMLFTSFCWHTEDNFLPSINYLHFGAPKIWCTTALSCRVSFDVRNNSILGFPR